MNTDAFTLDTSWSKRPKRNPTKEDILQAIQRMQDEDFVILSQAEQNYIQAVPGILEYRQDGRHLRCELATDDRNAIQRAMISDLQNDDFRAGLEWKDVTQEIAAQRRKQSTVTIIVALIAAILFILWMTLRD